jgi:predicted double-glycine peptidase
MIWEILATVLFGILFWLLGLRLGRSMVRRGATANDLFVGRKWLSVLALVFYLSLVALAVNLPQWRALPFDWRVYGIQVSWTIIRVLLIGACGVGYVICQKTARNQLLPLALMGLFGLMAFTSVEGYFLSPVYGQLQNNLRPNFIYRQSGNSSCAPAALATLMQRWNRSEVTEQLVAKYAGTSRVGTTMPQLVNAMPPLGMAGFELSPTWAQMRQMNRPGILAVWQITRLGARLPHAVALMAMTSDRAIIADPALGKYLSLTPEDFQRIWRGEYVPVVSEGELEQIRARSKDYLKQLGYSTVRSFQQASGIKATGKLDEMTLLMLGGKFIQAGPTLDDGAFRSQMTEKMGCQNNPAICPWDGRRSVS